MLYAGDYPFVHLVLHKEADGLIVLSLVSTVILLFAFSRGVQRILTALSLDYIESWSIVAFSLIAACLVWFPIAYFKGWLILERRLWLRSIPLGLVNIAIPAVAFTFAQVFVTAGVAALFVAFLPIVVALLGWMFLKERLSVQSTIGIVVATLGVVLLAFSRETSSLDGGSWIAGILLLFLGVISAAAVYIGWRSLLKERKAVELLGPQLAISTLAVIPFTLLFGGEFKFSIEIVALLTSLGVVNYVIPQIAMFWLLTRTTVIRAALANYLAPAIAVVLSALVLSEEVTYQIVVGGVLVIAGAITINFAKAKSKGV